ncbi:MAG: DUF192 domain-containing protein [Candidatus Levybacteria bacterium]|nr:DUF192 domain-containing protein [Candidatus Levybacteria bacterium]
MKKILIILAVLFVLVLGLVIFQAIFKNNPPFQKTPTVIIGNQKFKLYVVKEPKDQQIGLSKYENIPQDYGMLFIFDKADYHSFWMKKMKFPIDIIYIRNDQIVTILKNISPPKTEFESIPIYKPTVPADRVLEINAGLAEKYNFKEKDSVRYENLGN